MLGVTSRITSASVEGLSKKIVPKSAVKYDMVSGISKRGEFKVTSFYDGKK